VGGARYADAQAACDAYAKQSGALLIHPFDAVATLEATGTVALEWEEDLARGAIAPLDTVLVASGGGGLVAGMAAYWHGRVKIVAVEPEGSRCLHAALEAGHPVDVTVESVAADSLGARRAGDLVFAIAKQKVDRVVLVADEAIVAAQRLLWQDYRLASEPGGAAALGALVSGAYPAAAGERVGVLVCGGNVDPKTL
jgi:threonine dehydratase